MWGCISVLPSPRSFSLVPQSKALDFRLAYFGVVQQNLCSINAARGCTSLPRLGMHLITLLDLLSTSFPTLNPHRPAGLQDRVGLRYSRWLLRAHNLVLHDQHVRLRVQLQGLHVAHHARLHPLLQVWTPPRGGVWEGVHIIIFHHLCFPPCTTPHLCDAYPC